MKGETDTRHEAGGRIAVALSVTPSCVRCCSAASSSRSRRIREESRGLPLRTAGEVAVIDEGDIAAVADHDMVKYPDAEHLADLTQARRDMQIFVRRRGISAGMVMQQNEG